MWLPPWKFLPKFSLLAAQQKNHETEMMLLKAEHKDATEKLETENRNLHSEVDRLKQELSHRPEPVQGSDLPEIQVEVLVALSQRSGGFVTTGYIASATNQSSQAARFHLDELRQKGYVGHSYSQRELVWAIAHPGRGYLIKRGLLK